MNSSLKDFEKKFKIKIGSCKRLIKEVSSYEKESEKQKEKIEKMKDQNLNIYDIQKQEQVLEESLKMIPDSKNRLQLAINDLQEFMKIIESNSEISVLKEKEEWKQANELIQTVQSMNI